MRRGRRPIEVFYEFGILGPIEVRVDGEVAHLGGPRQRAVLVRLLIDRGRVVDARTEGWEIPGYETNDQTVGTGYDDTIYGGTAATAEGEGQMDQTFANSATTSWRMGRSAPLR